ncbi:MAG: hypothetical protein ACRDZO_15240 [Egibacteraceae bacterium]
MTPLPPPPPQTSRERHPVLEDGGRGGRGAHAGHGQYPLPLRPQPGRRAVNELADAGDARPGPGPHHGGAPRRGGGPPRPAAGDVA